jgi:hypothetical protein
VTIAGFQRDGRWSPAALQTINALQAHLAEQCTLSSLQGAANRLTLALTETRKIILVERASSAQLESRVRAPGTSAALQDNKR